MIQCQRCQQIGYDKKPGCLTAIAVYRATFHSSSPALGPAR
ncbi:MAG: hypothetical protein WBG32_20175 [Nodosilinea sp.]